MHGLEMPSFLGDLLCKYQYQNGERKTMIYGYARVSTDGQTLDAQHDALKTAGAGRVFAEKISGAKTPRQERASGHWLILGQIQPLPTAS
jgi:Resolvase, N terminal domain